MTVELRQPSFRGVPFDVDGNAPRELGRKVFVHSYPYRSAAPEDMGLRDGFFNVPAVILGPSYEARRDAFEAALNAEGPGILIHPWTGQVRVRLISAKVSETTEALGKAVYDLEFLAEPEAPAQTVTVDTGAVVAATAAALQTVADNDLAQTLTVAGQPQFVLDEAADVVARLADRFDATVAPLRAAGDQLSQYVSAGLALRSQVIDLVSQPLSLAAQVSSLFQGIRTLAATPADALGILFSLFDFGDELKPVSRSTPARSVQADNQDALVAFTRISAAVAAVQAVAETDFAAYQDATATRDAMVDRLDSLATDLADAGRDDAWRAVITAMTAMVADVTRRGGSLARLYGYDLPSTMPVLVLAYRLYGEGESLTDRVDEIVARNRIVHPGFIPGGTVLELLTSGSAAAGQL